jgi:tetratricopeptide (TPR) repeat protein
VSLFLQDIFSTANPSWSGRGFGPNATVVEAVDVAAKRIDLELAEEPEVAKTLHGVMAGTYVQLRQSDKAAFHARRQVDLMRELGVSGTELARGLHDLGAQVRNSGRPDSALPILREAYTLLENAGFPIDGNASATLNELGLTLWAAGRPREAVPFLKHSLDIARQLDSLTLIAVESSNLGNVLFAIGDLAGAEQHYRVAGQILVRTNKRETVERGATLNNLTTVLILTGAFEEAERAIQEGIGILTRILGPTNERVAISTVHLARVELATGRAPQALETVRRAAAMLKHLRPQHPERARAENYEAAILLTLNRAPEAEVLARRALASRRLVGAATDWRIAETEAILARILIALGKTGEAPALLEHSYQVLRDNMGPTHPLTREVERDRQLLISGQPIATPPRP